MSTPQYGPGLLAFTKARQLYQLEHKLIEEELSKLTPERQEEVREAMRRLREAPRKPVLLHCTPRTHTPKALAGLLYTAYCEAVGGHAHDGKPLPTWAEFSGDPTKTKQLTGWLAAARVAARCTTP